MPPNHDQKRFGILISPNTTKSIIVHYRQDYYLANKVIIQIYIDIKN